MQNFNIEMLIKDLKEMPTSWYPELLRAILEGAKSHNVFLPGGATKFVENWEKEINGE